MTTTTLFDTVALSTCMVGDRGCSGILVMISIHNRFILFAILSISAIILMISDEVSIVICLSLLVWIVGSLN